MKHGGEGSAVRLHTRRDERLSTVHKKHDVARFKVQRRMLKESQVVAVVGVEAVGGHLGDRLRRPGRIELEPHEDTCVVGYEVVDAKPRIPLADRKPKALATRHDRSYGFRVEVQAPEFSPDEPIELGFGYAELNLNVCGRSRKRDRL